MGRRLGALMVLLAESLVEEDCGPIEIIEKEG
jgi:hypothetical protein